MELVTRPSKTVSALAIAAPCPNTLGAFKKNLNKHMVAVAIIQKRDIVISSVRFVRLTAGTFAEGAVLLLVYCTIRRISSAINEPV
jgi:hypothetical protein